MNQSTASKSASEGVPTVAKNLKAQRSSLLGTDPASSRQQVKIDESHLAVSYANFCRVTGTPEELIVDFGLNPHPFEAHDQVVPVGQRIVMNYYTTKRLLQALSLFAATARVSFWAVGNRRSPASTAARKRSVKRLGRPECIDSTANDETDISVNRIEFVFQFRKFCRAITAASVPREFAVM